MTSYKRFLVHLLVNKVTQTGKIDKVLMTQWWHNTYLASFFLTVKWKKNDICSPILNSVIELIHVAVVLVGCTAFDDIIRSRLSPYCWCGHTFSLAYIFEANDYILYYSYNLFRYVWSNIWRDFYISVCSKLMIDWIYFNPKNVVVEIGFRYKSLLRQMKY